MMEEALDRLNPGLLRSALAGHRETCPLCGEAVLSVALHFVTCPKVTEEEEEEWRNKS